MASRTLAHKVLPSSLHSEIQRIQAGLPFRAVESLQKALSLPAEQLRLVLGISRATFQRRKVQGKLGSAESERLARFQRLLEQAAEVFGGPDDARQWLTTAQPALGGAVPVEFAASEIGAREVVQLLGRIEHGVYS